MTVALTRHAVKVDGVVVPALLALVAHDLVFFDPLRTLAWRWLHDVNLQALAPRWLAAIVPSATPGWDRDPAAAALAFLMLLCGAAYLLLSRWERGSLGKSLVLGVATCLLVVLPSLAFMEMGRITGRPYGQDGGVVQLPLAMDRIAARQSPYGADYSDSILGKEARASRFWKDRTRNPILHHHAYLPGTHLVMAPGYVASRWAGVPFDPRLVTLAAFVIAIGLAASIPAAPSARLAAAACVAVNPLVYWHQVFGANDIVIAALLLGVTRCLQTERRWWGAVLLGLACATKQLAWPFAPFFLPALARVEAFDELRSVAGWRRVAAVGLVVVLVFAAVVLPVAALDFDAFVQDIVGYNVGLRGADAYPLGGTPGFGFANFLIYFGVVESLGDYFPFGTFYALLVPLGLLLLYRQQRLGGLTTPLVIGSAALLAALYFSRVVHPNYLVTLAIALPIGVIGSASIAADTTVVPLGLLASAVGIVGGEVYRTTWADAVASHLPRWTDGIARFLLPSAQPHLTLDPLGLGIGALAAGVALVYLVAALVGLSARGRALLVAAAACIVVAVPALLTVRVARASGIVRAEHPWAAGIAGDRAVTREAWSRSFQKAPPEIFDTGGRGPAGGWPADGLVRHAARAWASPLPIADPRPIVLFVMALAVGFVWRHASREHAPLALGALLLSPLTVIDVPFGSGEWVFLAAVSLAVWATRWWVRLPATVACLPRGVAALPALMEPPAPRWLSAPSGRALIVFVLGVAAFAAAEHPRAFVPESDLTAWFSYNGLTTAEVSASWMAWGLVLFAGSAGVAFVASRSKGWDARTCAGATATLLWLCALFTPGATPTTLLTPLALLVLAHTENKSSIAGS